MALNKQLSVRFDPEMREKLELISNREHRPISNQIVHFLAHAVDEYMLANALYFRDTGDGLTIEPFPDGYVPEEAL